MDIINVIEISVTFVAAIIIAAPLYLIARQLKVANEQRNVGETERTEIPEIVVFLRPHASQVHCLMLCVENIGTSTAHNIRFHTGSQAAIPLISSVSNSGDAGILKRNDLLKKGVTCFGPGQKIDQFLITLTDGLSEDLKQPLQITVTYNDSLNQRYEKGYTLDPGQFEEFGQINSVEETTITELSQTAESTEPSQEFNRTETPLSATEEHRHSTQSTEDTEEHQQVIQAEIDALLPTDFEREFVTLYNSGDKEKLYEVYGGHSSIKVANETERLRDPNKLPVFESKLQGGFTAYATPSENLYVVVPFSGMVLQNQLYTFGGFGEAFECPGFDSNYRYDVKVIRPAIFKQEPGSKQWTLERKGKLELTQREH